jgi:hypothetical protein
MMNDEEKTGSEEARKRGREEERRKTAKKKNKEGSQFAFVWNFEPLDLNIVCGKDLNLDNI